MTLRTRLMVGALVMTCGVAAIARATPPIGYVLGNILSLGSTTKGSSSNVRVELGLPGTPEPPESEGEDEWTASFSTSGPTDFSVVDIEYASGGHTGWHSHPGILLSTMVSGTVEWYDSKCNKHIYNAGDSFTEDTHVHYLRNAGADNAHYVVTYVLAKGQQRRTDEPAPACAAALGLE